LIARCKAAEPHHGPVWQATVKDLKNVGKKIDEIVDLVADKLQQ
jgi:pre-mRNA-processing factor 6